MSANFVPELFRVRYQIADIKDFSYFTKKPDTILRSDLSAEAVEFLKSKMNPMAPVYYPIQPVYYISRPICVHPTHPVYYQSK